MMSKNFSKYLSFVFNNTSVGDNTNTGDINTNGANSSALVVDTHDTYYECKHDSIKYEQLRYQLFKETK